MRFLLAAAVLAGMCAPAAAQGDGKSIFEGKGRCAGCHSIDRRGGSLGPDLSEIGLQRTAESLRRSITEPDADIASAYFTVVLQTKDGRRLEGIVLNEDDISIQVRDTDGNPRSFRKENLVGVAREQRSLMPSYRSRLSGPEIDSVIAYLRGLKGSAAVRSVRRPAPLTRDIAWLTRANRDAQERPEMLLDSLEIRKGDTVVDLGAGAGYFTCRLAARVGARGRVLAVDVQQEMLDRIAQEVATRHLANVELIPGSERDPHLPAGTADLVLVANAYHEFSEPAAMLVEVRRALKPEGRLVVVEYAAEKDEDPVAGLATIRLDQLRSEIEAAGFQLDRILDFLPIQHGLIFAVRR